MLNTLNYSEAIDAFSSFLSCTPKWYIPINGGFYSFNSDNKCFLHNSGDDYNYLDMSGEERRSVIRLLVNDDYETTKTFDNVSYSGDFEDGENLIPFKFKTRLHTTNQVDDVYNREDTYKFSIPRDNSEDIGHSSQISINSIKYGRLYNSYAISDPRGLAPSGWRIANSNDFETLRNNTGGWENSGINLLSSEFGGTNEYGFSAVFAGYKSSNGGSYGLNTECNIIDSNLKTWYIYSGSNRFYDAYANDKFGYSVRLIKNNSTTDGDVIIDGDVYNTITIGSQVWLKQSLSARHYINGDLIGTDFSSTNGATIDYGQDIYETIIVAPEVQASKALFASRLRGKYMVCDYVFKSSDGNRFRLPYIETTYRYSMI